MLANNSPFRLDGVSGEGIQKICRRGDYLSVVAGARFEHRSDLAAHRRSSGELENSRLERRWKAGHGDTGSTAFGRGEPCRTGATRESMHDRRSGRAYG